MRVLSFLLVVGFVGCSGSEVVQPEDVARRLHETVPLIDGHNDLPGQYRDLSNQFSSLDIAKSHSGFRSRVCGGFPPLVTCTSNWR